jgi:hypothetical protein
MIETDNPALFNKGKELVKKTEEYKRNLKESEQEYGEGTKEAEMDAVKETMAELIGNKGENIVNESLKQGWKEWLLGLWKYLQSKFPNLKSLTLKEIENLTLDQFLGGALRDIMSGKEVTFKKSKKKTPMKRSTKGANEQRLVETIEAALAKGASLEAIKEALKRNIRRDNAGNPAEISKLTVELEKAIAQFTKKPLIGKKTPEALQEKLGIQFKEGNKLEVNKRKLSSWINGAFKNGYTAGAKDQRTKNSDLNKLKKDIAAEIKSLLDTMIKEKGKGMITTAKSEAIRNRFVKTNLLNPESVERFATYFDGVLTKANYVENISKANKLRSSIKKSLKDKKIDAALVESAKKFAKIDPNKVDNIEEYLSIASMVKEGLSKSRAGQEGIKWRNAFDIEKVDSYTDAIIFRQQIEALKDPALTKAKDAAIRTEAVKVFEVYKSIIDRMLKNREDPFSFPRTGEKSIDEPVRKLVQDFMSMDPRRLSLPDLISAVDSLNNFVINQTVGGMGKVVSRYKGATSVEDLVSQGVKAIPIRLYASKFVGRALTEKLSTLPVALEQMFVGSRNALKVQEGSGIAEITEGKSSAKTQTDMVYNDYTEKFSTPGIIGRKPVKANGKDFTEPENVVERGMYAFVKRSTLDPEKQKDEFERRKTLLKENIEVLEKASKQNGDYKQTYELYKEAYDKIIEGSKDLEEVSSKVAPKNKEAVDYWVVKFNEILPEMQEVARSVYNVELDLEKDYNPDVYKNIAGVEKLEDALGKKDVSSLEKRIYDKENPMLMAVDKPGKMPKAMYISLDFDLNNVRAYEAALVDVNTAKGIQRLIGFVNSPFFEKLIPSIDDRGVFTRRIKEYIRIARGKSDSSDPYGRKIVEHTDIISRIGTQRALAGLTQIPKQVLPVMINTAINAGTFDLNLFQALRPEVIEAIKNSGMPIANRGILSQAQIEGLDRRLRKLTSYKKNKIAEVIRDVTDFQMKIFLQNPDVWIAKASFITYYKKELKKLGLNPEIKDWKNHKWNKEAARYAQQMVDRQQNVSDSDLMGTFLTSRDPLQIILRKVFIPFASFTINQKARIAADLTVLRKSQNKEERKAAAKSATSLIAELAVFYMLGLAFLGLLGAAAKSIVSSYGFGEEEEEDEIKKQMKKDLEKNEVNMKALKSIASSAVSDIAVPSPFVDDIVKIGLNELVIDPIFKKENISLSKDLKEGLELLPEYDRKGKKGAELSLEYLKTLIDSQKDTYPEASRLQLKVYNDLVKEFEDPFGKYSTVIRKVDRALKDFEQVEPEFRLYERRIDKFTEGFGVLGIGASGLNTIYEIGDLMYDGEFNKEFMGRKVKMKVEDPDDKLNNLLGPMLGFQILANFGFGFKEPTRITDIMLKEIKKGAKTESQIKQSKIQKVKDMIESEGNQSNVENRPDYVNDIYSEFNEKSLNKYGKRVIDLTDKELEQIKKSIVF